MAVHAGPHLSCAYGHTPPAPRNYLGRKRAGYGVCVDSLRKVQGVFFLPPPTPLLQEHWCARCCIRQRGKDESAGSWRPLRQRAPNVWSPSSSGSAQGDSPGIVKVAVPILRKQLHSQVCKSSIVGLWADDSDAGALRDAWNRHLARCTNAVDNARVPSGRINKACEACSARKIRCSHGQTCRRCAQSNTPCHYLVHGRTRQPRTPVSDTSSLQPAGIDSPDNRNDNRPLASTIPQMSTPIGADDTQYSLETGGTNPWLSWEWHEPPSSPCLLWLPKSAMA